MAEKVALSKLYSALNEKLAKLFDESGVRRSFTVPYIEGQATAEHIKAVGTAATQNGGAYNNLITSAHHSGGKGWGSGDGHTVAHPADKLRTTLIPKGDENAKAAIDAAQKYLDGCAKLLGDDDPTILTANSQLKLVKKSDAAGMTLFDFGVFLIQITSPPTQAIGRAHSGTKPGGHSPQLRAPNPGTAPEEQESAPEAQGEAQTGGDTQTPQPVASAAPATPAVAPAPQQRQG